MQSRRSISRRHLIRIAAAGWMLNNLVMSLPADDSPPKPRVLWFTKSSGYEHDVVKVTDGPSVVSKVIANIATANGLGIVSTKDGGAFDNLDVLKKFAAIIFFTCGNLLESGTDNQPPMTENGIANLLAYVESGAGFVAIHSTSDSLHGHDNFLKMLGGEFVVHGEQQKARIKVNDPKFPGMPKEDFELYEEWYVLKNFDPQMHVLMTIDPAGMKGEMYQRQSYPIAWTKSHGSGRVFHTALAHKPETWHLPMFQAHLAGGLSWAAGFRD